MSKAKLYAADGSSKSEIELPEALFNGKVNEDYIFQYVVVYRHNQRQGNSKTKSSK